MENSWMVFVKVSTKRKRPSPPVIKPFAETEMTIAFKARSVICSEALGGDILQVTFDSVIDGDEECRESPYVLVGQCFEFPGPPTIEWHDGTEYNGGAEIRTAVLKRNFATFVTGSGLNFSIGFSIADDKFRQLVSFLQRIFPECQVEDTERS
jgi:hypothetical protein